MKGSIGSDIIGLIFTSLSLYMVITPQYLDLVAKLLIYPAIIFLLFTNLFNILTRVTEFGKTRIQFINAVAMFGSISLISGLFFGQIIGTDGPWSDYSFSYFILLSFSSIILLLNSAGKVEHPMIVIFTLLVLLVGFIAEFLVYLINLLFPPKLQELVPYIDAMRTLIYNIANAMADPQRLATETALSNLENVSDALDDVGEGYALRKSIGQGIDLGLTAIVIGLGTFTYLLDLGIDPKILILLFGSLGLALATFSGLFGPFYGLAGAAKDFCLHHGNYRGASFFKTIEEIFAIPFMAASAGFLLLDLPPVDAQTLEEFKTDMQEQLTEISDNINSLLGKNAGAVPRKTQKMIASMMSNTSESLSKMDFRNVREETAREFALTYYQHEFTWKPWKRKSAVIEFAENNHFDAETGEQTLKLIGYKIAAGQMDDDLVSNVMISASMRGVIMMEQKHQSMLDSVELGQTCTGLAFGARQFLKDHYIVRSKKVRYGVMIKNFSIGILAIPIVLSIAFHNYANRIFNMIGESILDQDVASHNIMRYNEIHDNLALIPGKIKAIRTKKPKTEEEKVEIRQQRNWELRIKIQSAFSKLIEVLIFPIKLLVGTFRWIVGRFKEDEYNPRQAFEAAVAHAALVAMYDELYKKLVMQTHVSSTY